MKNKKVIIALAVIVSLAVLSLMRYVIVTKKNGAKTDETKKLAIYTIPERKKFYLEGELQSVNKEVFEQDLTKGEIDKISVKDGQKVKKGDLLFSYKNQALIDQQEELESQLDTLKDTYNKIEKGGNSSTSNLLSESQYISGMKDQLSDNKKQQDKMKKQISNLKDKAYTKVYASFAGTVSTNKDSKNPVLTVVDPKMHIVCNVSEKEILDLSIDQNVNIKIYATAQDIKGKIKYIGKQNESNIASGMQLNSMQSTQTSDVNYYPIHIEVEDKLDVYQGFHVQISAEAINELPKIPKKAVVNEDGANYVWIIKDDAVNKKPVNIINWNDKYVKVAEGVTFKDKIVKEVMDTIKEGDKVDSKSNTN